MRKICITIISLILALGFVSCSSLRKEHAKLPVSYENAIISYLGPEGTYTQEACEVFFEGEGELIPCTTVNDAVQMLTEGNCDYAVIPQENTIGGATIDYLDTLIHTGDVYVTGEVMLTIDQNLLVLPGTSLSEITRVYSHKQGIIQGRTWLEENLPEAEVVEVSSTAEGARMVSEENDPSCAAIASSGCADVYGLDIAASGIQNNDNNKTRFFVLTCGEADAAEFYGERTAFIVTGSAQDLPNVISDIGKYDATLVTIHDRPLGTVLGEYNYLIECDGLSSEDYQRITQNSDMKFRLLGCYDLV